MAGYVATFFAFLGVENWKDAYESVRGLRERVTFTEDYETLKFYLAAGRSQPEGWQPIETAPRTGYFFILWDNGESSALRYTYNWDCWRNIENYVLNVNRVPGWWLQTTALPPPPAAKE